MNKPFAVAAAVVASFLASSTFAETRPTILLTVPAGLCAETKDQLASWSVNTSTYTVIALPHVKRSAAGTCGGEGPAVTAGIASGADLATVKAAALDSCNASRGEHGACTVFGTAHPKN